MAATAIAGSDVHTDNARALCTSIPHRQQLPRYLSRLWNQICNASCYFEVTDLPLNVHCPNFWYPNTDFFLICDTIVFEEVCLSNGDARQALGTAIATSKYQTSNYFEVMHHNRTPNPAFYPKTRDRFLTIEHQLSSSKPAGLYCCWQQIWSKPCYFVVLFQNGNVFPLYFEHLYPSNGFVFFWHSRSGMAS